MREDYIKCVLKHPSVRKKSDCLTCQDVGSCKGILLTKDEREGEQNANKRDYVKA